MSVDMKFNYVHTYVTVGMWWYYSYCELWCWQVPCYCNIICCSVFIWCRYTPLLQTVDFTCIIN